MAWAMFDLTRLYLTELLLELNIWKMVMLFKSFGGMTNMQINSVPQILISHVQLSPFFGISSRNNTNKNNNKKVMESKLSSHAHLHDLAQCILSL